MEIGAFFILVILLVLLAAGGGGLYVLTLWLRGRKLRREDDAIESSRLSQTSPGAEHTERRGQRPEHVEVENEQRTRFAGTR
jgi:hypothetical protein